MITRKSLSLARALIREPADHPRISAACCSRVSPARQAAQSSVMSIVRASSNPRCPADVIGALLDKSDDSGELAQYREVVAQPRLSVEYILVTRHSRLGQALKHRPVHVAVIELLFNNLSCVLKRRHGAVMQVT